MAVKMDVLQELNYLLIYLFYSILYWNAAWNGVNCGFF